MEKIKTILFLFLINLLMIPLGVSEPFESSEQQAVRQLQVIADDMIIAYFGRYPEKATLYGIDLGW